MRETGLLLLAGGLITLLGLRHLADWTGFLGAALIVAGACLVLWSFRRNANAADSDT